MLEAVVVRDSLLRCVDETLLSEILAASTASADQTTLEDFVTAYRASPRHRDRALNPLFDEKWYLSKNRDVREAVGKGVFACGFVHFVRFGIHEGRWPNEAMAAQAVAPELVRPPAFDVDARIYGGAHPDVVEFLRRFPVIDATVHYNMFGRRLGYGVGPQDAVGATDEQIDIMHAAFDAEWYAARHGDEIAAHGYSDDPFAHYLIEGMGKGYSPCEEFDEKFYRAFYPEIRVAIERGEIPSGFYHYTHAGRSERRVPRFDLREALEARIPGVTRPVLLERIADIEVRLRKRQFTVDATQPRRVWVLLPTINPDITFGGYRAVFELIRRLDESKLRVCVLCTGDGNASREYFLYRESSKSMRELFTRIEFREYAEGFDVRIGPADVAVAYSMWDLYAAEEMRQAARDTRVVLLAQEYEPIFYDNSAARSLIEQAYNIPHRALINSRFLYEYLRMHRIGVFAADRQPIENVDYMVFEHRINSLIRQSAQDMRARHHRTLVTYARPETHAARNMFEILVLALRRLCREGAFGPEWQFVGLGALSEIEPVELGGGHVLQIHQKMQEDEYVRYISSMDIGVSLMYAPHPSVVPFEFATTGALVVTNTYENRSAEGLRAICPNIIAGAPTIDGLVEAIRQALHRLSDVEDREKNAYRPRQSDWSQIMGDELIDFVVGHGRKAR